MIWNTELVNDLIDQYSESQSIKSLMRSVSINHILSDHNSKVEFPFLINSKSCDISYRSPNLLFEYTNTEIESLCEIRTDPTSIFKYIGVTPYKCQYEMARNCNLYRFNLAICSRGIGSTFAAIILSLNYILTNTDKTIQYICLSNSICDKNMSIFKIAYEILPFYMKVGILKINRFEIKFDNGCRIVFIHKDKLQIGYGVDRLVIDSCLINKSISDIILPCVVRGGSFLIISNKDIPLMKQNNNCIRTYHDWTSNDKFDSKWVSDEIEKNGFDRFIEDYCLGRITEEMKPILRDIKINSIL